MKLLRVGVAAIALAGLSACGGVHPGSAAVVGDDTISMGEVDDAVDAYCTVAVAVGGAQQDPSAPAAEGSTGLDIRQQAVRGLISLSAARQAAEELDISPPESQYSIPASDIDQIEESYPDADIAHLEKVLKIEQERFVLLAAIGEDQTGQALDESNREQLIQSGQEYLEQDFADGLDVTIDPRFSIDGDAALAAEAKVGGSGSLSVPVSDFAKTANNPEDAKAAVGSMPDEQSCSDS